jgi:hypothetical protein
MTDPVGVTPELPRTKQVRSTSEVRGARRPACAARGKHPDRPRRGSHQSYPGRNKCAARVKSGVPDAQRAQHAESIRTDPVGGHTRVTPDETRAQHE